MKIDTLIMIGVSVAIVAGMYGCSQSQWAADFGKKMEAKEAECQKPKLLSEVDGVRLYSYRRSCGSDPVYFSASGTNWETQECSGSGKTRRCHNEQHQVPNSN